MKFILEPNVAGIGYMNCDIRDENNKLLQITRGEDWEAAKAKAIEWCKAYVALPPSEEIDI